MDYCLGVLLADDADEYLRGFLIDFNQAAKNPRFTRLVNNNPAIRDLVGRIENVVKLPEQAQNEQLRWELKMSPGNAVEEVLEFVSWGTLPSRTCDKPPPPAQPDDRAPPRLSVAEAPLVDAPPPPEPSVSLAHVMPGLSIKRIQPIELNGRQLYIQHFNSTELNGIQEILKKWIKDFRELVQQSFISRAYTKRTQKKLLHADTIADLTTKILADSRYNKDTFACYDQSNKLQALCSLMIKVDEIYVSTLLTAPHNLLDNPERIRGVGMCLLNNAEAIAKQIPTVRKVILLADKRKPELIKFYETHGFKKARGGWFSKQQEMYKRTTEKVSAFSKLLKCLCIK